MAMPTTPLVPLINQLRASHSTLMVALLSRVVTPQIGPYGEVLRKEPEPLTTGILMIPVGQGNSRRLGTKPMRIT
jgi:hypothetical protein